MSIRERIKAIQSTLRDVTLTPEMAREYQVVLTALLGNVLDEARVAEVDYAVVELAAYGTEQASNRAKLVAKANPAYLRMREAKDTEKLVVEMIRSCRAYLRSLDEEMRLAR